MKIFKICSIVLLLSILVSCSEKDQGILINNNSSFWTIVDVSITPSTDLTWSDNLLGNSIIDVSSSYLFDLDSGVYDVRLIDDFGDTFELYDIAVVVETVTELDYNGFVLAVSSMAARNLDSLVVREKGMTEPAQLLKRR